MIYFLFSQLHVCFKNIDPFLISLFTRMNLLLCYNLRQEVLDPMKILFKKKRHSNILNTSGGELVGLMRRGKIKKSLEWIILVFYFKKNSIPK